MSSVYECHVFDYLIQMLIYFYLRSWNNWEPFY